MLRSKLFEKHQIVHGFIGKEESPPWLQQAEGPWVYCNQVHGSEVLEVRTDSSQFAIGKFAEQKADAIISTAPKYRIGVKTADCIPLLMSSQSGNVVAAVHAGWRGFSKGVAANAFRALRKEADSDEDILAVIGPCLCSTHFEVGEDVVSAFTANRSLFVSGQSDLFISKGRGHRFYFNLKISMQLHLQNLGFKPQNIDILDICTYCNLQFHSHRRDREERSGSNWSWIESRIKL